MSNEKPTSEPEQILTDVKNGLIEIEKKLSDLAKTTSEDIKGGLNIIAEKFSELFEAKESADKTAKEIPDSKSEDKLKLKLFGKVTKSRAKEVKK